MTKIKRRKKITHTQFCSIFTRRKFTRRDKVTKNIYMVEDINGNYRIEEHPTVVGYITFSTLALVMIIPIFLYEGLKGIGKLKEEVTTLFNRKPIRHDDLKHNTSQTAKLLEITGWYN